MNREERRRKQKELRKHGFSKNAAKAQVAAYFAYQPLDDGAMVRLNYELMIRHKDWRKQSDEFKKWVEDHKNDLFHVEYDEKKKENNAYDMKFQVHLKEDTTDPKWLFNSETLIPIATAKVKLESGEEAIVPFEDFKGSDPNELINSSSFNEKINSAVNKISGT